MKEAALALLMFFITLVEIVTFLAIATIIISVIVAICWEILAKIFKFFDEGV